METADHDVETDDELDDEKAPRHVDVPAHPPVSRFEPWLASTGFTTLATLIVYGVSRVLPTQPAVLGLLIVLLVLLYFVLTALRYVAYHFAGGASAAGAPASAAVAYRGVLLDALMLFLILLVGAALYRLIEYVTDSWAPMPMTLEILAMLALVLMFMMVLLQRIVDHYSRVASTLVSGKSSSEQAPPARTDEKTN